MNRNYVPICRYNHRYFIIFLFCSLFPCIYKTTKKRYVIKIMKYSFLRFLSLSFFSRAPFSCGERMVRWGGVAREKIDPENSPDNFVSTLSYCAIHIHPGVRWFSCEKKRGKKAEKLDPRIMPHADVSSFAALDCEVVDGRSSDNTV